jgi:hypothetical protein
MSTKKNNPEMEGGVSRQVNFDLKKEDLMLLILEGRKEVMEEEISKIQQVSAELYKKLRAAQEKFRVKLEKMLLATVNAEAKRIAQGFAKREEGAEEADLSKVFKLVINKVITCVPWTRFKSSAIGDGKGATYIKQQNNANVDLYVYNHISISINISLHGKTFANKNELFYRKDYVKACNEYAREFTLVDEDLNTEVQMEMKEYKELHAIAEEYGKNESLLSDVLAEYDLFNRNQPRAKAKMIKEVLSRDDAGNALLGNIMEAARGRKLLVTAAK